LVGATLACLLWGVGGHARVFVALLAVVLVPGWWLAVWSGDRVPWFVRITVGPALIAIAAVWGAATGVGIPVAVWLAVFGGGVLLALRRLWRHAPTLTGAPPSLAAGVTLAAVGLGVVWTRMAAIESLALPPWVDAVHHALLIRVAAERGHAPWDLTPYLPVTALTYHSGFHSIMGVVYAVSGLPAGVLGRFLLITGQYWNVLAVLVVAGYIWTMTRSWWASVGAMVTVGLVSFMPAYYLSWGRYTLVAGMVMLPAALWVVQALWATPRRGIDPLWLIPTFAVLALVHMVVFVMALLWVLVWVVRSGRIPAGAIRAAVLTLLATLPWWWLVVGHTQLSAGASAMHLVGNQSHNALAQGLVWALNNRWLIPLALLAGLVGIRRGRVWVAMLVIWYTAVLLLANPPMLGLPYLSFFTNETVITTLYLPMGMLIATRLPALVRRVGPWAVALLCIAVGAVTIGPSARIVNQETVIATADDAAVLAWAADGLPADAVVLTNATGWMWGVDRGSDGGWWLTPLAGIETTTPPVLYTYAAAADVAAAAARTHTVATATGTLPSIEALVAAYPEVNYIYASERGVIKPSVLDTSQQFEVRFRSGDAAVYAVIW
jgi:hypothetical protein